MESIGAFMGKLNDYYCITAPWTVKPPWKGGRKGSEGGEKRDTEGGQKG